MTVEKRVRSFFHHESIRRMKMVTHKSSDLPARTAERTGTCRAEEDTPLALVGRHLLTEHSGPADFFCMPQDNMQSERAGRWNLSV